MKRRNAFFLLLLPALFAHLLLFGRAVDPRLTMVPEWSIILDSTQESAYNGSRPLPIPFHLPGRTGYISQEGELVFSVTDPGGNMTVNSKGFAVPGRLFNPSGRFVTELPENYYPYFTDFGSYLVASRREAISEIDGRGNILWERFTGSLITCFADSQDLRLIGTVDGKAVLVDGKGAPVSEFVPAGSNISAMYGAAIGAAGERIALISGADPQMLVLYERVDSLWKMRGDWELPGMMYRETLIDFMHDSSTVRLERDGSLLTVDLLSSTFEEYAYEGRYLGSHELAEPSMSVALFGSGSNRMVFFDRTGSAVAEIDTREETLWFDGEGPMIFLGFSDRISALSMLRM
jgi:hypothetical protein